MVIRSTARYFPQGLIPAKIVEPARYAARKNLKICSIKIRMYVENVMKSSVMKFTLRLHASYAAVSSRLHAANMSIIQKKDLRCPNDAQNAENQQNN